MAILEGGHIVPPPHSSYIQKPRAIRVNNIVGKNVWNLLIELKWKKILTDEDSIVFFLRFTINVKKQNPSLPKKGPWMALTLMLFVMKK